MRPYRIAGIGAIAAFAIVVVGNIVGGFMHLPALGIASFIVAVIIALTARALAKKT
jgi:Na+/citrate or Na+/malate symporter